MRIIIISQVFWPDTASTAQHLSDLAEKLAERGHAVTVYSSRYAYENPGIKYPRKETFKGIRIRRLQNTGLGKKSIGRRLVDFGSFNILLFLKLITLKKKDFDVIIGMTSPPLISYLGIVVASWKKKKFLYWGMDLQPELAIASGLLKPNNISTKLLTYAGNAIIRKSDAIIALDKYMRDHFVQRGASQKKVHVIPVWPVINDVFEGHRLENPFRIEHGFRDKIVVMYSGNHSFVHPLDTLLNAILSLKNDPDFLFVFIGEGVRKNEVTRFREIHRLTNVIQLPYQHRNKIHLSLGSADLQVVIMGDGQVGYTHPNKIYGAMFLGKPILYIGPAHSHITDILCQLKGNIMVDHGADNILTDSLRQFKSLTRQQWEEIGKNNKQYASRHFLPDILKKQMTEAVEQLS